MLSDVLTPGIPPLTFRTTLACFATGVTVVTTAIGNGLLDNDGLVHGMTANAFSSDTSALSTARLYTLSLPGHSLWSIANGNPLNPECLGPATDLKTGLNA